MALLDLAVQRLHDLLELCVDPLSITLPSLRAMRAWHRPCWAASLAATAARAADGRWRYRRQYRGFRSGLCCHHSSSSHPTSSTRAKHRLWSQCAAARVRGARHQAAGCARIPQRSHGGRCPPPMAVVALQVLPALFRDVTCFNANTTGAAALRPSPSMESTEAAFRSFPESTRFWATSNQPHRQLPYFQLYEYSERYLGCYCFCICWRISLATISN